MPLPQPTALTAKPRPGSIARVYMAPTVAASVLESHEVPLSSEDIGVKGAGEVASVRTHALGMLYAKNGIAKSFSFMTHGASNNTNIQNVVNAADATGPTAKMKFVVVNGDGSYDYGFCIVNDKSPVQAPDGIFGYMINCSVIGDGEYMNAVSVEIVQADQNLAVAATLQLTLVFDPADTVDTAVTYQSSDVGVATVNASGLVTGVAAGVAIITVTTTSKAAATDSITITVP